MSKAGRLSGAALSDKAVARLVKTAAAVAGLDPERYSGHSLRVAAVEAGVPTPDISTPADIAAARDRAGLPSLAALAAQLGVSRQTLHSWGRTSRVPSWVSLACAGLIAQAGRPLT